MTGKARGKEEEDDILSVIRLHSMYVYYVLEPINTTCMGTIGISAYIMSHLQTKLRENYDARRHVCHGNIDVKRHMIPVTRDSKVLTPPFLLSYGQLSMATLCI